MKPIYLPNLSFSHAVHQEILLTIGRFPAERGGILGGNPLTGEVTHFYFDADAETTATQYHLNADRINPVIVGWNRQGVHLMGIVHSHPKGVDEPSDKDVVFAWDLLLRADNSELQYLLIPIVQSAADGTFAIRIFAVTRNFGPVFEVPYEQGPLAPVFPIPSKTYEETFARIRDTYHLPRLFNSMVTAAGAGGGAAFVEDVARSGVRHFQLIDGGRVESANIATSQYYRSEVGEFKVEALKRRILDINPLASINAIAKPLDDISDEEFRELVFPNSAESNDIEARLLCGLTDNFWCQARIARLGLNFQLPTLAAQVYRGGRGAEIVFMHPGTTKQCNRCILSHRYSAYLEGGFQNDATTAGAQYIATPRLNATKLIIAMAILHHGTPHPFWGPLLTRIGQRNCIQIRCDPDFAQTLGLSNFDEAFAGTSSDQVFFDETIWRRQHPENLANGYEYNCPDCGGTGNLRLAANKFRDTRLIQP
jgi:proteasome lid subunit RPN8/RPN11